MSKSKANKIIDTLMEKDYFSQWLGVERIEEGEGFCKLKMIVRPEMCNGFSIAHGGISFSFADSALAFASNSQGKHAVSIETSISHIKPILAGDVLIASATEKSRSNRIGNTTKKNRKAKRQTGGIIQRNCVYQRICMEGLAIYSICDPLSFLCVLCGEKKSTTKNTRKDTRDTRKKTFRINIIAHPIIKQKSHKSQ